VTRGTLLVIAAAHDTAGEPQCGPPRPHHNDDRLQGNLRTTGYQRAAHPQGSAAPDLPTPATFPDHARRPLTTTARKPEYRESHARKQRSARHKDCSARSRWANGYPSGRHSYSASIRTLALEHRSRCVMIAGCGYRAKSAVLREHWLDSRQRAGRPDLSILHAPTAGTCSSSLCVCRALGWSRPAGQDPGGI